MSIRSLHPLIALAGTAVLGLSLVSSALAQDEVSPSPSPGAAAALETRFERPADLRAERQAARAERKAERAATRTLRRVERQERKAAWAAARRERAAGLGARKAVWAGVKEACAAELQAVRTEPHLDRAGRREALRRAKASCREQYLAARAEALATDELYTEAAAGGTSVVRTDLGITAPGSAPGQVLGLWHYLIPAGTALAPHTHPGWQLARVTDGELEYTVVEGEGVLLRADGSQEPMGPGTYLLEAGDGVIENPTLVHLGANRTDEPVTLISATIFEAGQAISTVVEVPAVAE